MSTSSATYLIVIRRLSKIIFFNALMFSLVVDEHPVAYNALCITCNKNRIECKNPMKQKVAGSDGRNFHLNDIINKVDKRPVDMLRH